MAANTAGMCGSFKAELLQGYHVLTPSNPVRLAATADTFFAAVFKTNQSLSPATTTVYNPTGEVSGTGYVAGGVSLTWNAVGQSGIVGYTTPTATFLWTGCTITTLFDTILIYNQSQTNRSVALYNFGPQTVLSGNLTLNMPANNPGSALLQIA